MHYTYLILRKKNGMVLFRFVMDKVKDIQPKNANCCWLSFPEISRDRLRAPPTPPTFKVASVCDRFTQQDQGRKSWVVSRSLGILPQKKQTPSASRRLSNYVVSKGTWEGTYFSIKKNTTHTYSDLRSCCYCDYSQVFFLFLFFAFPHNSTTLGEVYFNSR